MPLKQNISDREYDKFVMRLYEGNEKHHVLVYGQTLAQASGLTTGGLHTEVELVDFEWRPLPATPLTDRNAISIQNYSGVQMKVNYSNSIVGYVGTRIADRSERFYDITDEIILYGRLTPGSGPLIVDVEELA